MAWAFTFVLTPTIIAFVVIFLTGVNDHTMIIPLVVLYCTILMSGILFGILMTAADTFILCALEDYERNDGSQARPYHMSDRLKEYVLSTE